MFNIRNKKIVLILAISVVIIFTLFFFIFTEQEKLKINKLGLTLDDLPDGYVKGPSYYNSNANEELGITYPGINEAYYAIFTNNQEYNSSIGEDCEGVICALLEFNSTESANNSYKFYSPLGYFASSEVTEIIYKGNIGEEFIIKKTNITNNFGFNYSKIMINYRIDKIVVSIITIFEPAVNNIDFSMNLAKIVEQNIYDNNQ